VSQSAALTALIEFADFCTGVQKLPDFGGITPPGGVTQHGRIGNEMIHN
jgi:hypothetical protein